MVGRHGIFGLGFVRHHGGVLLDIAGQRPDRHLVIALGVDGKDARVRRFGSLNRALNAVFGAQFVALERVTRDCRPCIFAFMVLARTGELEHDSEGRTRANGVTLIVFFFFIERYGLFRGQIAAVEPHAATRPLRCAVGHGDRCFRCNNHATRATRRSLLVLQVQLAWRCSGRRGQARAVSLRQLFFFEYKVVAMIGVVFFVERENRATRLQKHQLTLVVRRTQGDGLALRVPVGIRPIQGKLGALDRLAVLVDLLDLGRRQGGEVELKRHIRCARAALQIKEAQRVLGAVAEGVVAEVFGICAGGVELRLDGGIFDFLLGSIRTVDMTDFYFTSGEINLKRCFLVNAAQIAHEHAVDIHPHIVVARELKDHVLAFSGLATVRLDKLRGHGHAKVMVEIRASINDLFRGEVVAVLIKNLACRVKGKELAQIGFFARIVLIYARFIVDVKGIGREVIHSVVAVRAVRAVRVVDVVTILELEEALHVAVDSLAILLAICLTVIIKEISQRLVGVVNTLALGGVGASLDLRIALYKLVLNKL